MAARPPMELLAARKVEELVDAVVFAMHDALRLREADAIHGMRVSIRRLQQALRIFAQFLSKRGVKRVRGQLKKAMDVAGDLRNHDIALELTRKNGEDLPQLRSARNDSRQEFRATLRRLAKKDLAAKWRDRLGLSS